MKPNIFSEIESLNKVFVYSPGSEHNKVLPDDIKPYLEINNKIIKNDNFLLFDDILDLNSAKNQHDAFKDIINFYKEDSCVDLREYFQNIMTEFNIDSEFPLINLMYPRDIAVTIGNQILLTKSSSNVRSKENVITREFFNNHPEFRNTEIIDFEKIGNGLSLEGGDVFVINKDIIMIGISERTSIEAINLLIPHLFEQTFKYVIAIDLPKERAMMHLDTIFTQTDYNEGILFDNHQYNIKNLSVYMASKNDLKNIQLKKQNFTFENLFKEIGIDFNMIMCGGSEPNFQLREQLTDGANSFVLEPGKIIMYDCNQKTILELERNGYKHITSKMFYYNLLTFEKVLNNEDKVVISINGSELVKGRGGPRCMTLPISRGSS